MGGDIFIHCGDLTNRGSAPELQAVNAWLSSLPHEHKIVICGNMDKRLESVPTLEGRRKWFPGVCYLEDELVEVAGLRIYGSPYTPKFCGAWQLNPGKESDDKWAGIPDSLDILITHGPALHHLDCVGRGRHAGCPSLLQRVKATAPRYHLFGHIHEEGGREVIEDGTTFINAAQHVMVFDIEPKDSCDGTMQTRCRSRSPPDDVHVDAISTT